MENDGIRGGCLVAFWLIYTLVHQRNWELLQYRKVEKMQLANIGNLKIYKDEKFIR